MQVLYVGNPQEVPKKWSLSRGVAYPLVTGWVIRSWAPEVLRHRDAALHSVHSYW